VKTLKILLVSLLVVGLGVLVGPGQAAAGTSCHKINAKGVGQDLGGGTTQAQIKGGGLLQGTTEGHFAVSPTIDPNVFTIVGTVTFTTNKATLTVSVNGTFNVATGAFTASGPVIAATGKLAGATGDLTLTGIENLTSGAFTETVTGNICADLSP
jgi:hypothetical protein